MIIRILLFLLLFLSHDIVYASQPRNNVHIDRVERLIDSYSDCSSDNVSYFYVSKSMMRMVRSIASLGKMNFGNEFISKIDFLKGVNVTFTHVSADSLSKREMANIMDRLQHATTVSEQERIMSELQISNSEKQTSGKTGPNIIAIRDKIEKIAVHAKREGYELLMRNKERQTHSSIYFKKDRNDGSVILFVTKEKNLVSVVYIKGRFSTRDLMNTFNHFR